VLTWTLPRDKAQVISGRSDPPDCTAELIGWILQTETCVGYVEGKTYGADNTPTRRQNTSILTYTPSATLLQDTQQEKPSRAMSPLTIPTFILDPSLSWNKGPPSSEGSRAEMPSLPKAQV
jgi:hypothetical protein